MGGKTKNVIGQMWTNRRQTNAIWFVQNWALGGANFTQFINSKFQGTSD